MSDSKADIRGTLLRIVTRPYLPFVLLWVLLQVAFATVVMVGGDELYYAAALQKSTLLEFSIDHYLHWSPRTLLEIVEILISSLPYALWRVLNPLFAVLGVVCMSRALGTVKNAKVSWVLCAFLLLQNWQFLSTAGWISTTIVYLWTTVAATAAMVPVLRTVRGEKVSRLQWGLCIPPLLFGCNMEQTLLVCLALLGVSMVYLLVRKRHVPVMLWVYSVLAALSAVYIFTCPGEHARYMNEVTSYYKDFGMHTVFSRFEIGLTNALNQMLLTPNYLFAVLCALLGILVWVRYKNVVYRIAALVPLVVSLFLGVYGSFVCNIIPKLSFFGNAVSANGTVRLDNCDAFKGYVPLLMMSGVLIALILVLYLAFGHTRTALFAFTVFLAGFASYGAMGFTPAVGISGQRTAFVFTWCCIVVGVMAYRELATRKKCAALWVLYAFLGVYAAVQTVALLQM